MQLNLIKIGYFIVLDKLKRPNKRLEDNKINFILCFTNLHFNILKIKLKCLIFLKVNTYSTKTDYFLSIVQFLFKQVLFNFCNFNITCAKSLMNNTPPNKISYSS